MPQRLRVCACQSLSTTAATRRFEFLDVRALLRRNQGTLVFGVAGLATTFASLPAESPLGFGMRMLAAGRQRRMAWGLVQTGLEFGESSQQGPNNGLCLGGLASDQFLRDLKSHAAVVGSAQLCGKPQPSRKTTQGVNDYGN